MRVIAFLILIVVFIVLFIVWLPLYAGAWLLKKLADIPEEMLDALAEYLDGQTA